MIDQYESDGGSIEQVDATISGRDDGPSASVDVVVPRCGSGSQTESVPEAARLEDDGTLHLEFDPSALPELDAYAPEGVTVTGDGARVTADGDVVVTFAVEFDEDATTSQDQANQEQTSRKPTPADLLAADPERDLPADDEDADSQSGTDLDLDPEIARTLADARDEDLPPYEDVAYLERLYESFDTFAAMAEVIEMDVAAETVRRYMTDAGVHDPVSYDVSTEDEAADAAEPDDRTASASDPDPEPTPASPEQSADSVEQLPAERLVADGLGLPEGVDLEELIDAVESSMTLYDVCRRLELERERTRELLTQLDLLDLVVRRVYASSEPDEGPSREAIAERIRGSAERPQTRSEPSGDSQSALS